MTIKQQLARLVQHKKSLLALNNTPLPVCGIEDHIHILGLDELAKAAKAVNEQVEVSLWNTKQNKWKASFIYNGMEVFAIGNDADLAAAGLEEPS